MKKILLLTVACMLMLSSCSNNSDDDTVNDEVVSTIDENDVVEDDDINNQEVDYIEDEQLEEFTEELQEILEFYKGDITSFPQLEEVTEDDLVVVLETSYGDIKIKMFPEYAPETVTNFITHIENDYYDGIVFHRVIDNFMIQSGDPTATGMGGESIWGSPFEDEFEKSLRHFNGALSMANSGPNTNGSQFFIIVNDEYSDDTTLPYKEEKDSVVFALPTGDEIYLSDIFPENVLDIYDEVGGTPHLDFNHSVFGQVVDGYDVLIEISNVEVSDDDRPVEDVIINDIRIIQGSL